MLAVCGSVAIDTIRTPRKIIKKSLGGAAFFAAISASNFTDTGIVGVVGKDFPKEYYKILASRLDMQGLSIKDGKTFHYDGIYDKTLSNRSALKTELNVLAKYSPTVPESYKKSQFVYLANSDPQENLMLLKEFDKVKFSMCDTIDFWINTKRNFVIKMIKAVDAVVINDEEAKQLTKEFNLIKCAKKMMDWGAKYVIIKKGEHGSLMFYEDMVFPTAGFSLKDVIDPTGAGDSFAGAMIGYLADKKTTSMSEMKKAIIYGNVMGSFAVERYGSKGLEKITKKDIQKRVKIYEKMIKF